MTREEIMENKDPHQALIAIMTSKNFDLTEMSQMMEEYAKKYGITTDEMAFYPNGERVITPEIF